MKHALRSLMLAACLLPAALTANTAPTVVIQSATMRPGTTLMDVVYRVNDPDDATVKTRALAFVDGERSFAKVVRPVTFVEGTAAKLGDAIPSNTNHTLTWDVAADWDVELGQIKFEVLAMDGRGLLTFDWITIPAAGGKPALSISKDAPTDAMVLDSLFWRFADGDTTMTLTNGILAGNSSSGAFEGVNLVSGSTVQGYGAAYVFKGMNLDPAAGSDIGYAVTSARVSLLSTTKWHALNRAYTGVSIAAPWGSNNYGETNIPSGLNGVLAIAAGGGFSLALKTDGTVVGWGSNTENRIAIPAGLTGVIAIAAGEGHGLALKSDGTVVGWGRNSDGQASIPAGLTGVTAISAGDYHSLALKSDGTVVGWGWNSSGQITTPTGLTGVTAISGGSYYSLALKSNGTVVQWGGGPAGSAPTGLTGVIAIAAGASHALALKSNGTVVAWGRSTEGQTTIPVGLTGVTAISAGEYHSLALKSDGTVVQFGQYYTSSLFPAIPPAGLNGVTLISVGCKSNHAFAVKAKAR